MQFEIKWTGEKIRLIEDFKFGSYLKKSRLKKRRPGKKSFYQS